MEKNNNWSDLLLMANKDLQKTGMEIEVVKNIDDYYTINIKDGENTSCFADNYFEDDLLEVINDAWANARIKGQENNRPETLYIVTHVTVSSSEPNANGYVDTKVFYAKEKAEKQLKDWRASEIELRQESECAYHVYDDTDTKFHCTWDNDNEGIIITVNETMVQA